MLNMASVLRMVPCSFRLSPPYQVGEYIARCVLRIVDPLFFGDTEGIERVSLDRDRADLTTMDSESSGSSAGKNIPPRLPPRFRLPRCVSGKLPGGLYYMRAVLAAADSLGSVAVKSFATGRIFPNCEASTESIRGKPEGRSSGSSSESHSGSSRSYCNVRVDSLDRVCDMIYCGAEEVESRNLSKIVGVQIGYLQVRPFDVDNA